MKSAHRGGFFYLNRTAMKNTIIAIIISLLFLSCKDFPEKKDVGYNCTAAFFDGVLVSTGLDSLIVVRNAENDTLFSLQSATTDCLQPILMNKRFLYASVSDEQFQCIDINTKEVKWRYTPPYLIKNFKVMDNYLLLSIKRLGVIIINAGTGKVVYELKEDESTSACYSPYIQDFFLSDGKLYISDFRCDNVICLDVKEGKEIWRYKAQIDGPTRILDAGRYIFCGVTGNPDQKEGSVTVLDKLTGVVKFVADEQFDLITRPLLFDDTIIYCSYDGKVRILDLTRLEIVTLIDSGSSQSITDGEMHLIDGVIYFVDTYGIINRFYPGRKKLEKLHKAEKQINAVFKTKDSVEFIY